MKSIKKIICAIDFSPASKNALLYAIQLADVYRAEVELVHVVEVVPEAVLEIPQSMAEVNRKIMDDARENLRKLAEDSLSQLEEKLSHVPVFATQVDVGPIGITINRLAKDTASLIVVGSRGDENRPWWSTSVTKQVIDYPTVPVLVVPAAADYEPWERVTFATDLRRAEVAHVLELVAFFQPRQPELQCLHIVEDDSENKEMKLQDFIDVFQNRIDTTHITFHQSEEDDLTEALEAFNLIYHADLQVLVRPKRTFLSELFHSSQSKKTAGYTHVPLLVWPG